METMWKTPHNPAENVIAGIAECLWHVRREGFWELKQKVRVEGSGEVEPTKAKAHEDASRKPAG